MTFTTRKLLLIQKILHQENEEIFQKWEAFFAKWEDTPHEKRNLAGSVKSYQAPEDSVAQDDWEAA
jgi:hypothetical protein